MPPPEPRRIPGPPPTHPEPPLRLVLGTYPCPVVEAAYRQRLDTWNARRPLASRA
ncbi:hypothetical protein [Streptomyces canus]|uniref:hypothetical protein n=1 Tax=Streptomyces canus TaxID=58343 RepID=UPI000361527A|nr:hypothetical protein [Streptomyces canus]